MASVLELSPISIYTHEGVSSASIRLFQLTLNNVTVELSSLGASVTKVLLTDYSQNVSTPEEELHRDDVVLSYASPKDQYEDKNKPFFGAIVGRVANRIKGGSFELFQTKQSSSDTVDTLEAYQLDTNNGQNHLHGGYDGFCNRLWSAEIIDDTVSIQFTLISPDGDQGYPGGIK